jgi:uncharacterized protein (DUF58 family)
MSSPFTLNPDLLGAFDDIPLLARNVVEGFLSGLHQSPFLGYSTEFASYRQYMQGDDLRHVDWKVWGRTDKLHVKQFESETNLTCHLLLDTSASMDFGQANKFQYGRALAAALAYLMVRQHDAPGLTLFGDEAIQGLPAHSGRRHLDDLFQMLAGAAPQGHTAPGPDFWNLLETFDRRGLTVVISDLLLPGETGFELLHQLHYHRQEIIVFHLLAPEELDFRYAGECIFEDAETREEIPVHAGSFRAEYLRRLAAFRLGLKQECEKYEIDYHPLRTDAPVTEALIAYLQGRLNV